jgi:hypothetical protein
LDKFYQITTKSVIGILHQLLHHLNTSTSSSNRLVVVTGCSRGISSSSSLSLSLYACIQCTKPPILSCMGMACLLMLHSAPKLASDVYPRLVDAWTREGVEKFKQMTVLDYSSPLVHANCDALFLACSCQLMRPYNSLADQAKCRSLGYTLGLIISVLFVINQPYICASSVPLQ